MAAKQKTTRKKVAKETVVWASAAAALLIATLLMLVGSLFPGADYRKEALESFRRVEFDLSYDPQGNARLDELRGQTLSLEAAKNMAELSAETKEPLAAPPAEALPVGEIPAEELPPEQIPALISEEPITQTPPPATDAPAETPVETPATVEAPATDAPVAAQEPPVPSQPTMALAPVEQQTEQGILPVIAPDGTKPWNYFAKTTSAANSGKPRIAVVVSNLGLVALSTQDAIALPPAVTLSFSPYGRETTAGMAQAAADAGHETLLDLPMQTALFPAVDPGPYGIRNDLDAAENLARLTSVLTKARSYVGLLGTTRDTVSDDVNRIVPLIEAIAGRGLLYVAGHSQPPAGLFRIQRLAGVPVLMTDIVLDDRITDTHIRNQLARAEDRARNQGSAVVVGRSYPITVDLLAEWLPTLEAKGFVVVPISALGK